MPAKSLRMQMSLLVGMGVIILCGGLPAGQQVIKLKVIYAGAPVYREPKISEPFTTLLLDTLVDAEVKKGEFWKVTVPYKGAKTTGYVHENLVNEVKEGEEKAADAPGTLQAQLAAEIKLKLNDIKEKSVDPKNLAQAADDLRSLIARTFRLENPQQQKQMACDIYLWIGHVLARQGDEPAAIKEYRNMFEVDELLAKKTMDYVSEARTFQLISTAEKQYNHTFGGYLLRINTVPTDAVLRVDGKEIGRSPYYHKTFDARVTLEIEKEGFKAKKETISLVEEETVLNYTLESLGRPVRVTSTPPGAAVLLDGQDTGKVTDCELPVVPLGMRTLTVRKVHYADWEETFMLSEGDQPLTKSAALTVKDYELVLSCGGPGKRLFINPKAIALDKGGNFYVADESKIKVRKFNSEGLLQRSWGSEGQQFAALKIPSGIAIDGQGNFYVTDAGSSTVSKFDKNGQLVKTWGKLGYQEGELQKPLGLAVDRNNDILVVDHFNNRIVKYSPDGAVKKTWGKKGTEKGQLNLPTAVAVCKNNDVIVIDQGRIQKFTSEGVFIEAFGKPGSGEGEVRVPTGISLDAADYIYVTEGGNDRIMKFAPNGRFIGKWGSTGVGAGQFIGPAAVAINEKGSVFVVDRDKVQEFALASK